MKNYELEEMGLSCDELYSKIKYIFQFDLMDFCSIFNCFQL